MSHPSKKQQIIALAACLLIAFAAAAIGAIATANAGAFYKDLSRPPWAPPSWSFGPVWMVLYAMIGIATWLVWRRAGIEEARSAHLLNLAQLALNALWSWLFFAWKLGALAVIEIIVLWFLIGATVRAFWKFNALAGALLLPYWLWVTFAAFLAYAAWQMNPTAFQ